jgi:hypothetical protein
MRRARRAGPEAVKLMTREQLVGMLVLVACFQPATASAAGDRAPAPRLQVSWTAVGNEVSAAGVVGSANRHSSSAVLQERVGAHWMTRAKAGLRRRRGVVAFSLIWAGAARGQRETMRVQIVAGKRVVAASGPRTVRATGAVTVQRTLRPSTERLSPTQLSGPVRASGDQTVLRLARGAQVPTNGAAIVIEPSRELPNGLLAVVTGVSRSRSGATVTTKPGALEDAYSAFDARINGTLEELAEPVAAGTRNTSPAHDAANLGPFNVGFSCDDPSASREITHTVDLKEVSVHAEVTIPSWGNGYSGPGVLFTLGGQPKFDLGVTFKGEETCHAKATARIPIPAVPGLVIEIGPDFTISASGSVNADLKWTPWIFYGFSRFRGVPDNDWKTFNNNGSASLTGTSKLTLGLALDAGISLYGRVGINGSLGPEITGVVTARTSPIETCASVSGEFAANLSAYADAFFRDYTFHIASARFGHVDIYSQCATPSGGGPGGGTGSGASGGTGSGPDSPSESPQDPRGVLDACTTVTPSGDTPLNEVSVGPNGEPSGGFDPELNRSGDIVWFQSTADLVRAPMSQDVAVYVRNLATHTTCRVDVPGAESGDLEWLEAISPDGRYAMISGNSGQRVVDEVTGVLSPAIPYLVNYPCCAAAHRSNYGLEDDGRTLLAGHGAGEFYDVMTGLLTQVKCPNEEEPNTSAIADIDLENPRYAGVVGSSCGTEAGYTLDLATNAMRETAPYDCEGGLYFPCLFFLIPSEVGSHLIISSGVGVRYDGTKIASGGYVCGLTETGEHGVIDTNRIEEYDAAAATLKPVPDIGSAASCWKQSVSTLGEIVYEIEGRVRLGHTG